MKKPLGTSDQVTEFEFAPLLIPMAYYSWRSVPVLVTKEAPSLGKRSGFTACVAFIVGKNGTCTKGVSHLALLPSHDTGFDSTAQMNTKHFSLMRCQHLQ